MLAVEQDFSGGGDPVPAEMRGAGASQGLSWSWELDFDALARCIGDDGSPDDGLEDEEASQEAVLDAVEEHGGERIPAAALAGQIAEHLPAGAGSGGVAGVGSCRRAGGSRSGCRSGFLVAHRLLGAGPGTGGGGADRVPGRGW